MQFSDRLLAAYAAIAAGDAFFKQNELGSALKWYMRAQELHEVTSQEIRETVSDRLSRFKKLQ